MHSRKSSKQKENSLVLCHLEESTPLLPSICHPARSDQAHVRALLVQVWSVLCFSSKTHPRELKQMGVYLERCGSKESLPKLCYGEEWSKWKRTVDYLLQFWRNHSFMHTFISPTLPERQCSMWLMVRALGSNPSATTYVPCGLEQVTSSLSFLVCSSHLKDLLWGINESIM